MACTKYDQNGRNYSKKNPTLEFRHTQVTKSIHTMLIGMRGGTEVESASCFTTARVIFRIATFAFSRKAKSPKFGHCDALRDSGALPRAFFRTSGKSR